MQTKCPSCESSQIVHRNVSLTVVSEAVSECEIVFHVANDFSDKLERLIPVATELCVFFIGKPIVDLVLSNYSIPPNILDLVVRHQEITKKPQWFFLRLFERRS